MVKSGKEKIDEPRDLPINEDFSPNRNKLKKDIIDLRYIYLIQSKQPSFTIDCTIIETDTNPIFSATVVKITKMRFS